MSRRHVPASRRARSARRHRQASASPSRQASRWRALAMEQLEDRRVLAFDPFAGFPDPVVSVAALSPAGVHSATQNQTLSDGLTIPAIIVFDGAEILADRMQDYFNTPLGARGANPNECHSTNPYCEFIDIPPLATGPFTQSFDTEVVWAGFPGSLNFNFADSWFNGNALENFTTLGLFGLGAYLTFIDHFRGEVNGPNGQIWSFNHRAPGFESYNIGNEPGHYSAGVYADDFANHSSSEAIEFDIVDDDATGPEFIATVGFASPAGEDPLIRRPIEMKDNEIREFFWIVEDRWSGLSDVQATFRGQTFATQFEDVQAGEVFRNRGYVTINQPPVGTHTLRVRAEDADGDRDSDTAVSELVQSIKVVDDDSEPPRITITGPSGTAEDQESQVFTWSITDDSPILSYSVDVTDELGARHGPLGSYGHSGFFNFDSLPAGHTYTITVNARDNDFDGGRDSDRRSAAPVVRSVYVKDDDPNAPVIRFTNGAGNALLGTSYAESHGVSNAIVWDITDQSGVQPVQARLYRDGTLLRQISGPASKVELLDGDGLGTFRLDLTATENDNDLWPGDQRTSAGSATLTITNAAPTAFAGGPYVLTEGQPLSVLASGSDPDPGDTAQLVFSWDLDGDNQFDDASGAQPTVTWNQLSAAGIADDGTYTIRARAADIYGAAATATATVTVYNAPPQVESILADPFIDENTTITATGRFSDPSPLDTHQVVVYWGDGTSSSAVVNQADRTFQASHHYDDDRPSATEYDDYVLRVEVLDDEGAVNPDRSLTMSVVTNSVGEIELPSFPLSLPPGVSGRLQSATVLVDPLAATLANTAGQAFNHSHVYDYPVSTANGFPSISSPFDLASKTTSTDSAGGAHTHSLDISGQTQTFSGSGLSLFQQSSELTFPMLPLTGAGGFVPSTGLPAGYQHDHPRNVTFDTTTTFTYYPTSYQTIVNTEFASTPSNVTLNGNAYNAGNRIRLTDDVNWQNGTLVVETVNSPINDFVANFRMFLGAESSSVPADGLSFVFGPISNGSLFDEEGLGFGTGLSVTFDTYKNADPDVIGITAFYNGTRYLNIARVVGSIATDSYVNAKVSVNSSGVLTIEHPALSFGVVTTVLSGWGPQPASWRFGLGARTGGANELHTIDNLTITAKYPLTQTVTRSATNAYTLPKFTGAGSLQSAVVTLDSPSQAITSTDGGQFLHDHDVALNVGPFSFAKKTTSASALSSHAHSVDFLSQSRSFTSESDLATYFLQEQNLLLPQNGVTSTSSLSHSHTLAADSVPFTTITEFTYDVSSAIVRVRNVDPQFTQLSLPSSAVENSLVNLSGTFEDRGTDDTHEVVIDWADGSSDVIAIPPGQRNFAVQHLYRDDQPTGTASDTYVVRVTVRDDDGGQSVSNLNITLENEAPTLSLGASVAVLEGSPFALPAAIFMDRGRLDTHTVITNWGDTHTTTGTVLQGPGTGVASDAHVYRDDGSYNVLVTLRDDDNEAATQTLVATILNAAPTILSLQAASPALEGAGMRLQAAASDPGVDDVLTYTWDFGDGSPLVSGISLTNVVHVYGSEGTYTASLTVSDGDGGSATRALTFVVPDLSEGVTIAGPGEINEGASYALTLTTLSSQAAAAIASWSVNWGDGTSQTFTTAGVKTHVFADGDQAHTISVEINKAAGGTTAVGTIPVTVRNVAPTIASFSGNATGLEAQTRTFTALATDPGADGLTYTWDFGDGTPAQSGLNLTSAQHAFVDDGAYIVRLTVADGDGGMAESRLPVVITNVAPTIALAGAVSAVEGSLYELTLGTVSDPGTDTVSQWLVDWGDGTLNSYGAGGVVTHAYPDGPDGHTIVVALADEDGVHNNAGQLTVSVLNAPPVIHAITGDTSGPEAERFELTANVTDPAGPFDVLTYVWNFGDGSPTVSGINLVNVQHEYVDNGLYTVSLTVTDEDLQSDTATIDIAVANVAPTTVLAGVPQTLEGALYEVRFAPVLDPGADAVTQWIIAWGDGETNAYTNPQSATHTYRDGLVATEIVVTLVDEDGSHARAGVFPITVLNVAPQIDQLDGASIAAEGSPIMFHAAAHDAAGLLDPLTYRWDFGDGSPAVQGAGLATVNHAFADNGLYVVTVSIDDGDGGTDSRAMQVLIEDVAPTIDLPGSAAVLEGAPFELTLGAITDPGADVVTQWLVDWGDGISEVYVAPGIVSHAYADGHNDHVVRVGLVDEEGVYQNAGVHPIRIDNAPPSLTQVPFGTSSLEGALTTFEAAAVDPAGAADTLTYTWDFGDGTLPVSGPAAEIEHLFADSGEFTVTVTVADEDGGSASAQFQHVVTNVSPTIQLFGAGAAAEGTPYLLTLGAISDPGQDTVTQWIVDWGDGTIETKASGGLASHTYSDGSGRAVIAVTLRDEDGTHAAGQQAVTILNVSPTVVELTGNATGREGDTLQFTGIATDPAGAADTLTYVWNFGDGTDNFGLVNLDEYEHVYSEDGTFTVRLSVRDEDGGVGFRTMEVQLQNVAPQFEAGADELLLPPVAGVFSRTGIAFTDPGADVWSGTVNYQDGTGDIPLVVNQQNKTFVLNHTFVISGTFDVVVTLQDDDGGSHTDTFELEVILNTPPVANNDAVATSEDSAVTFSVLSNDTDEQNNIVPLATVNLTDPAAGVLTNHGDGTFTFEPNGAFEYLAVGESAVVGFNYRIFDSFGEPDDASVAITVTGVNDRPTVAVVETLVEVDEGSTVANHGSFADLDLSDLVTISASRGIVTQQAGSSGTWAWTFAAADGPNESQSITITATDNHGVSASTTFDLIVRNVTPTAHGAAFSVVENTANGTVIGTATASDPGADVPTFAIVGGTGAAAFAIDPASGAIRVSNSALLDVEANTTLTLLVTARDEDGATSDPATITINLLNQASISGVVFVDVNQNGLFDSNELAIDAALVELLDEDGDLLRTTATEDGFYLFDDLVPGTYRVREVQPSGVTDGAEHLGSLGGTLVINDVMQLTLARSNATDYDFAERGTAVSSGETAGIGFWQNKHGQELIAAGGSYLAYWLTTNFGNVFGDRLAYADGNEVAQFYKEQLFKQKGGQVGGPAKVDAQFMAVALAVFFTNRHLAGDVAEFYGFHVTDTGTGAKVVNVGTSGAAFGVANGTQLTIMQLLWATNALTDQPNNQSGFANIYDVNGDGVVDSAEAALRTKANALFSWINEQGGN